MDKISEFGLAGTYKGIENRITELDVHLPELSPVSIYGRFFYLTFRGKEPTIQEFIDFLYPKIIPFCIPRSKRFENLKKFQETGDDRYHMELSDQARNLFIKAANCLGRSGEPGELILFALLEAFFDAPQIACKMYLKTSENMPVHGTDSIHLKYDSDTGELILIWGESKLGQKFSATIDNICSSISSFNCKNQGRSPRDRDIDIIKDHANIDDPAVLRAFLDYFDPYTSKINKRRELYCCLSAFDYPLYHKLVRLEDDKIEEFFKINYIKHISKACLKFKDGILSHGIDHLSFIFILLPFKSVAELRNLFFQKLGCQIQ
jgi:hypothetical protein